MSTRRNRRVSPISPDTSKTATRRNQRVISPDASKRTVTFHTYKYNGKTKSANGQKEVPKSAGCCPCHLLRNAPHSAVKILRIVRAKMTRTFCFISRRDTGKDNRDSAHSHQSEAVEDCIAFDQKFVPSRGNSMAWTPEENKASEDALARYDCETLNRWEKVALLIPGKTAGDVAAHYKELESDISYIEMGLVPFPQYHNSSSGGFTLDWETQGFKPGYCVGGKRGGSRGAEQERKKGVPWTEEEHKRFLLGFKKYGRGDWRNISRNYVTSRTPTQVASHAQKYFIRLNSGGKDKRRSNIHDITTVNLPDDERAQSPSAPSVTSQSSTAAIAVSDHFSVIVDSKQPNEGIGGFKPQQFVQQSPYGISSYNGIKSEPNNSYGAMLMQQSPYEIQRVPTARSRYLNQLAAAHAECLSLGCENT